MNAKKKVFLVVLDGATFDPIKAGIKKGMLPTFKKLIENGVSGINKSTFPPSTCPAFDSLITGMEPDKVGIPGFLCRKCNSYDYTLSYLLKRPKAKPIWTILSENGKKVCIINVPTSYYPYDKINGVFIPGWITCKWETFPPTLKEDLDKLVGGYEIDLKNEGAQDVFLITKDNLIRNVYRITEKHYRVANYLLKKCDWNFFMVVFVGTDRLQHKIWQDKHAILAYYARIDQVISDLIGNLDDGTTIFVISDHGFGPLDFQFNLQDWLAKLKLLRLKKGRKSIYLKIIRRSFEIIRTFSLDKVIVKLLHPRLITIIEKQRRGVIEDYWKLGNIIDWSQTKAYGSGIIPGTVGFININLKGREPNGIVEPSEFVKLKECIIEELKKLCRNRALMVEFPIKDEMYNMYADEKPDIVFYINQFRCYVNYTFGNTKIFSRPYSNSSWHTPNGIFIAFGNDIKNGEKLDTNIIDFTPTILHILRAPIPASMDGRVLREIFKEKSELREREEVYQERIIEDEKRKIKVKLSKLKSLNKI